MPQIAPYGEVDTDTLVEIAALAQRVIGQAQAMQLIAIAELRLRRGDDQETADEIGLALAMSKHQADRQVDLAEQLTTRYPRLLASLERGDVDVSKVVRVVETGLPLSDEQADRLDAAMQNSLAGRDASAIQRSARYRVDRLDPEGAAQRFRRRRKNRKVELSFCDDGMADLTAYLPAEAACAIYARIDAIAKSDNSRRDGRSLDGIRADVLTELLLGTRQSFRQVQVQVTVPITTLMGARDFPGDLEGYGADPGRHRPRDGRRPHVHLAAAVDRPSHRAACRNGSSAVSATGAAARLRPRP